MKFGEYLISKKMITADHLKEALIAQRFTKEKIGRILKSLGHLSKVDLNNYLSEFMQAKLLWSYQDIVKQVKAQTLDNDISSWVEQAGLIILDVSSKQITCLATKFSDTLIEEFENKWPQKLVIKCIKKEIFDLLAGNQPIDKEYKDRNTIEIEVKEPSEKKILGKSPYVSLFRDTLKEAQLKDASDIHIEPTQAGVSIHLRVNGDLSIYKKIGISHREGFINEVKCLTNLSLAKFGKAQDTSVTLPSWNLNLRASSLPSLYGENIVLRLLDQSKKFDISRLQLDKTTLEALKIATSYKNGLILLSGPTGSGKTTTLFSLLNSLNNGLINIKTIEDPIEYTMKGITQIATTPRLNFADILRAVLRQDPDVILVGEIRDEETAQICLKAASTGHLVLSTTHANGAMENIGRLKQLGVDEFQLLENLRFSAAQRLLKRICKVCARPARKEEVDDFNELLKENEIVITDTQEIRMKEISDCPKCSKFGRIPLLEYMTRENIQSLIKTKKVKMAKSLLEAMAEQIIKGNICLREVYSNG